jgi:hypothetical protein
LNEFTQNSIATAVKLSQKYFFKSFLLNFDIQFITMRKLITLLFVSTLSYLSVSAQTEQDDYVLPEKKETALNKVSGSIVAGTGVGFSNGARNAVFSSFVAPQIGYNLSSKWKLNVGMMHYTMSGNSVFMNSRDFGCFPGAAKNNFNAAALGLEYKISNNAYIGISTSIGNGNFNYMNNPLQGMNSFSNSLSPFGMFPSFGR